MSLIKFFIHRRRSIFTAGTDAVRADTWRPAVELWPAAVWSLTAAALGVSRGGVGYAAAAIRFGRS